MLTEFEFLQLTHCNFCSAAAAAAAAANYPSLLPLPEKWETQHASLAAHPVIFFLSKDLTGTFFCVCVETKLAKLLLPSAAEKQNRH